MRIYTNLSIFYRLLIGIVIGVIVGSIGGVVRIGWELLFPLQFGATPETQAHSILQFFGISPEVLQLHYVFASGHEWHIMYLVWHFGFSIIFSLLYVIVAEFWLRIKFGLGIFFGFIVWIVVYVLCLPLLGFVAWQEPAWHYYVGTCIECLLWVWLIELTRRDLRNRMTSERDPI